MMDKVTEACHRIEELYYETGGKCYVSFSGGKDSTVILALIKLCEEVLTIPVGGIPAVYCNTGIELGVTTEFVRWVKNSGWYSNVEIIRPEKSFHYVLTEYGKPAKSKLKSELLERWQKGGRTQYVYMSLVQGLTPKGKRMEKSRLADKDAHMLSDDFAVRVSNKCCKKLKKEPFAKFNKETGVKGQLIGLRVAEEGVRKLNIEHRVQQGGKLCTYTKQGVIYKAPIVDWTNEEMEAFIKEYNVPLSDAYTKYGFHRTGCMLCPYSQNIAKDLQYLYDHEPNRYKAAMHWLKDVYIAQNVILPFDEAYERERENMARSIRTNAARNVAEVQAE